MAKFKAILHGVKIDKDGESSITLSIPQSDRNSVLAVSLMTEIVLDVEVLPEDSK